MKYISTRGQSPALSFEEVMLTGLAPDGGLYVPETLPTFDQQTIKSWSHLTYAELAFNIMKPFVEGCFDDAELRHMVDDCYAGFRHDDVAPLVELDANQYVLELFHGPTLAFKDFALQMLGRMLNRVLTRRQKKVVILGATSGDTGSAAIEGCRGCDMIDIFILHPHERVSDVQRKQMTSVLDVNVVNIAVQGNFDDCQQMVKDSFADQSFLPEGRQLVAVNSINWARIMAQIVYYFSAAFKVGGPYKSVSFSVPTGNFGDIFAGYLAKKMGLPIHQLIVATNANDILHRYLETNNYEKGQLLHTMSPSMDIMVSSNFERLLFDALDRDGDALRDLMQSFNSQAVNLPSNAYKNIRSLFDSMSIKDDHMVSVIKSVYETHGYLLDPHSAIGYAAALEKVKDESLPMITLATAHPAKFPEPVLKSGYPRAPELPDHMCDLFDREERYVVKPNDLEAVQSYVTEHLEA
ncbi:MAG: threonine synthase [Pseudomonadota bacterium]